MTYRVIGSVQSRTLRVLWMLEEMGIAYDHIPALPHAADVVQFNPAGKVPVLVSDGVPISDSVAIMTYLGDAHGQFTFASGTIERARQDSLKQFIIDEFDQILWMAARHSFILPEDQRMPAIKDSLKWEFERNQRALIPRMAEDGPYLMGVGMTIPDILLAHCGFWAGIAKFPIVEPRFADFLAMMRARPALHRAMAAAH